MAEKKPTSVPDRRSAVLNVALVGGGDLCIELLQKTTFDQGDGKASARIVAVSDPDPGAPCMEVARDLGLKTETDCRCLYDPLLDIHLIIVLIPDDRILLDILDSRPPHIRIMSNEVFNLFWEAIGREEQKLRKRNREMETIINGIQDFIVVISAEMEIVDVNEAFLKGMGYSRDEVIGRKCFEVFQKTRQLCSSDAMVCPLHEALHSKMPSQQVMTRVEPPRRVAVRRNHDFSHLGKGRADLEIHRNQPRHHRSARRRKKSPGGWSSMVGKRTRQLKETHAKLLHQDKMASLGKLAASVVHEINNPIAGILNLIAAHQADHPRKARSAERRWTSSIITWTSWRPKPDASAGSSRICWPFRDSPGWS